LSTTHVPDESSPDGNKSGPDTAMWEATVRSWANRRQSRSWSETGSEKSAELSRTWVRLGCNKTSRGFLWAPKVAIGAVKLQLVTSGRWTVTARPREKARDDRVSDGTGRNQTIVGCGGVVQLVRTPACHAGGREFESRRSRQFFKKHLAPYLRSRLVCLARGSARFTISDAPLTQLV
jgi:hypothetical protein